LIRGCASAEALLDQLPPALWLTALVRDRSAVMGVTG
jgi:hypothetical protein